MSGFFPSRSGDSASLCRNALPLVASLCLLWAPAASAQTTVPGKIPGEFAVSPSGAATYRIPIQVPPGVSGMEPKLALSYNSQAGNGIMGMGWSIEGLSAITRCPKTMATDGVRGGINHNQEDRFCLDGQRLINVVGAYGAAGSVYRTEVESFSKVSANGAAAGNAANGPESFTVKTKAGLTMEYGATADSRIEAQGKAVVRIWALSQMRDVKGNAVNFSYAEDNAKGEYRIENITYAGDRKVLFTYEDRPDKFSGYELGARIARSVRLSSTRSMLGASEASRLSLLYRNTGAQNSSLISSITGCSQSSGCAVALNVGWGEGVDSLRGWQAYSPNSGVGNFDLNRCKGLQAADMNGDGLQDMVCVYDYGNASTYTFVQMNNGGGLNGWQAYSPNSGAGNFDAGRCRALQAVDINGDGLRDMVCAYDFGNASTYTFVQLNNGGGLDGWKAYSPNPGAGNFDLNRCRGLQAADLNGDGLVDMVCVYDYPNVSATTFAQLNNGGGLGGWQSYSPNQGAGNFYASRCRSLQAVDINADGLVDMVCAYDYGNASTYTFVQLNAGGALGVWKPYSPNPGAGNFDLNRCKALQAVDLNGDGLPDMVCVYDYGNASTYTFVQLNNGTGLNGWNAYSPNPGVGNFDASRCVGLQAADINGDGLLDTVCAYNYPNASTYTFVQLNNGAALGGWKAYSPNSGVDNFDVGRCRAAQTIDMDGDGLPEMVCAYDYGNASTYTFVQRNSGSFLTNKLVSLTASARMLEVGYWASTQGTVAGANSLYESDARNAAKAYPTLEIRESMQMVSSVKQINGAGGMNQTTYSYGGLKAEQASAQYPGSGRGMLGFRWMKSREESTGIESYTEFAQTWPYIGMPVKSETRLSGAGNGGVLKRVTTNYGCYQSNVVAGGAAPASSQTGCLPGWSAGKVYFPFATSIAEESWDLNGTALPVLLTTQAYGGYADGAGGAIKQFGDPTEIRVDISEGGVLKQRKLSSNEYQPAKTDGSNWELGRLKRATVTVTNGRY